MGSRVVVFFFFIKLTFFASDSPSLCSIQLVILAQGPVTTDFLGNIAETAFVTRRPIEERST